MQSSAQLRILASELRRLRERTGLSQEQAAERIEVRRQTLGRLEGALNRPLRRTLSDLMDLYGASDNQRAVLTRLWTQAHQDGWVNTAGLSDEIVTFLHFEGEATREWEWAPLVPGLLQTEEYAAVVMEGRPRLSEDDRKGMLSTRVKRQERLWDGTLELWAILDEAALARTIGGASVMRDQAERLCEVAKLPNVTLQVLPFTHGAYAGTSGPFIVLDFPEPSPSVVYLEHARRDTFLNDKDDVQYYRTVFDLLRATALSPSQSVDLINQRRKAPQ